MDVKAVSVLVTGVLLYLLMGNSVIHNRTRKGAYPPPDDVARVVILLLWPLYLWASMAVRTGQKQR